MADKRPTQVEKRLSRRAKMSQLIRVRPSEPEYAHFEELPVTVNVSRSGLYFHTNRTEYAVGMRLFVTYPFTFASDPMAVEYVAEVIRTERLANNRTGVAIRLLMSI